MMSSTCLHRHASRPACSRQPRGRTSSLHVVSSIRARWCIDVRYGCKQDATALLQEWVRDVGKAAGLNASNTRLSSGAIGVPESRLEMEVSFSNLAEWEQFLACIPFKEHKAWSQRIQSMVTNDDSPKWEVFRAVPVEIEGTTSTVTAAAVVPQVLDTQKWMPTVQAKEEAPPPLMLIEDSAAAQVVLDWKGEPMRISPGDKLPFKFL